MDAYLDNIHDILQKLKNYLEGNEDEVIATTAVSSNSMTF